LLSERSGARSGASQKSGRAEQSGERVLQKNDGAERSVERDVAEHERSGEQGVTVIGWSVKRLFRRSRSAHKLLRKNTCGPLGGVMTASFRPSSICLHFEW